VFIIGHSKLEYQQLGLSDLSTNRSTTIIFLPLSPLLLFSLARSQLYFLAALKLGGRFPLSNRFLNPPLAYPNTATLMLPLPQRHRQPSQADGSNVTHNRRQFLVYQANNNEQDPETKSTAGIVLRYFQRDNHTELILFTRL